MIQTSSHVCSTKYGSANLEMQVYSEWTSRARQLIMNNHFDPIVLPTATNLITSITTPATV
ncbi:hypothetical protein M422DRAFT_267599 [Sphaerobolus stellatus SS14]|uniref:Uncharacterized protein n=1 Tax=Sphaerobolus stellatus (strain SS14) TaxID=990650 RepID=A0A0C9UZE3_SPHS4|nr:hypothetical protein M422DRAFT_267599 [Sphaerobolus stellatus SS14]